MADKLKPCPFCGGEAQLSSLYDNAKHIYRVWCTGCHISFDTGSEDEAVAMWNNRQNLIRKEDDPGLGNEVHPSGRINPRIDEVLECGMRYARFKLSLRRNRQKIDSRRLAYLYLLERIRDEVTELYQAIIDSGIADKEESGRFEGKILGARPTYNKGKHGRMLPHCPQCGELFRFEDIKGWGNEGLYKKREEKEGGKRGMKVENCMKCPQSGECDYTVCNLRYANGTCPDESCDLLKDDKLMGLPDYCHIKDITPSKCPVLAVKG